MLLSFCSINQRHLAIQEFGVSDKKPLTVTNTLDFEPQHQWLNYAHFPAPLPCPAALPFDRERLSRDIASLGKPRHTDNWAKIIPVQMGQLEASVWLLLLFQALEVSNDQSCTANEQLSVEVRYMPLRAFTPQQAIQQLQRFGVMFPACLINPLLNLINYERLVDLLVQDNLISSSEDQTQPYLHGFFDITNANQIIKSVLVRGLIQYRLPYCTDAERQHLRELVLPHVAPSAWPAPGSSYPEPIIFWLAAALRMHKQMRLLVESWADQSLADLDTYLVGVNYSQDYYPQPSPLSMLDLVFSLGDPALVIKHFRRLGACLERPEDALAWLVNTGLHDLEPLTNKLDQPYSDAAFGRIAERIKSPRIAPTMLTIVRNRRGQHLTMARRWLKEQKANAIVGLLPVALGRGRLAQLACEYLREQCVAGHEAFVCEQIDRLDPQQAATLRRKVVQKKLPTTKTHTATSLPAWFREAAASLPKRQRPLLPVQLRHVKLPTLIVDGASLSEWAIHRIIKAAKASTLDKPHPLIAALRQHVNPVALDHFARQLAQLYVEANALPSLNWMLHLFGLFGGEETVAIMPKVFEQLDRSTHLRVLRLKMLLNSLSAIGGDSVVQTLFRLKRSARSSAVYNDILERLDSFTEQRDASYEQLFQQTLPTLGLDERGRRRFDYGPRQFEVTVGPNLILELRDQAGRRRKSLPPPNKRDDPQLVQLAVSQWRSFRDRFEQTIQLQTQRFERAMIESTRWSRADFERWIVTHPLISHLARLLVWQGHADNNKPIFFRITPECCLADVHDHSLSLDGITHVSVAHPINLSIEELQAWQQIFADHELIQPFAQLDRPMPKLPVPLHNRKYFHDLVGRSLDGYVLDKALRSRWERVSSLSAHSGLQASLFPPPNSTFPQAGFVLRFLDARYMAVLGVAGSGQPWEYTKGNRVGLLKVWFTQSADLGDGIPTSPPIVLTKIPMTLLAEVYRDIQNLIGLIEAESNNASTTTTSPSGVKASTVGVSAANGSNLTGSIQPASGVNHGSKQTLPPF